jgi:hypothetical protein
VVDPVCVAGSTVAAELASTLESAASSTLPVLAYSSEADLVNWRTGCRDLAGVASWGLQPLTEPGLWGPLHPRQMRDLGTPPVLFSVKTAYRAMSIARDQLGTFPFPVDRVGRMQQAYPAVSACFDIGVQPLPLAPVADHPVQTSADGRYGWFYWRPVTCCVKFDSIARCGSTR